MVLLSVIIQISKDTLKNILYNYNIYLFGGIDVK